MASEVTLGQSTQVDVDDSCGSNPPCRWGDYSAALWSDQVTGTRQPYIWMASSYIADSGDGTSNWSTRVAEVVPQGG